MLDGRQRVNCTADRGEKEKEEEREEQACGWEKGVVEGTGRTEEGGGDMMGWKRMSRRVHAPLTGQPMRCTALCVH